MCGRLVHPVFYNDCAGELESIMGVCDAWNELFAEKLQNKLEEGKAEGKTLAILELLEEIGPVDDSLKRRILSERDQAVLSCWLKAAAKAESMDDFERRVAHKENAAV